MARYLRISKSIGNDTYINIDQISKIEENKSVDDEEQNGVYIHIDNNPPIHFKMSLKDFISKCKTVDFEI
jgi:hypothetical protein